MKKMLLVFSCLTIAAFLLSFTIYKTTHAEKDAAITAPKIIATCTGSKSCKACKNCNYCKHCAKDGGTCGVCK
jgi:hypothetical protein